MGAWYVFQHRSSRSAEVLAIGETPAQIEAHVRARFGDIPMTRQVRAAAEYLQDIG